MPSTKPTIRRCPKCGAEYPSQVLVCLECKTILAEHSERPKTPVWFILLLILIIVALAVYAIIRANEVFILHRF